MPEVKKKKAINMACGEQKIHSFKEFTKRGTRQYVEGQFLRWGSNCTTWKGKK